ncbi:phosphotransferase [Basfia succiniciproducens]|uniref:phosphotransferase n=1 Tax=Basfia succiniciproducens TaxID=653940 RepID=UPI0008CAB50A|nr:phosphotransferase [Basfia succiniciproducens]SEP80404.1 tRNA A-37 threonylcarbamoyl transferase component Bud32 [Basfia succiniciproducens]
MTTKKQAVFSRLVNELIQKNQGKRIFSFDFENQTYWVKQPEKLAGVWKILKPHPKQSFREELHILKNLYERGASVPQVVLSGEDFFVLKDVGPTLNHWIENAGLNLTPAEKNQILVDAIKALTSLHKKGVTHGRPAIRDIAWRQGKVTFMDFESHSRSLNLQWHKIRDVLVFIHSLCRSKHLSGEQIQYLINKYEEYCEPDLWQDILNLVAKFRFLYYILLVFKPVARMDLIAIYRLFQYLLPLTRENK